MTENITPENVTEATENVTETVTETVVEAAPKGLHVPTVAELRERVAKVELPTVADVRERITKVEVPTVAVLREKVAKVELPTTTELRADADRLVGTATERFSTVPVRAGELAADAQAQATALYRKALAVIK